MEESLFRRAKLEAARQGRPLAAILEEALRRYFDSTAVADAGLPVCRRDVGRLVAVSAGTDPLVMEEEDDECCES